MIDTSQKHTYIDFNDSKVVLYFSKYNFTDSEKTLKDMQEKDSVHSFTKTEILSASIVANKFKYNNWTKLHHSLFNYWIKCQNSFWC